MAAFGSKSHNLKARIKANLLWDNIMCRNFIEVKLAKSLEMFSEIASGLVTLFVVDT